MNRSAASGTLLRGMPKVAAGIPTSLKILMSRHMLVSHLKLTMTDISRAPGDHALPSPIIANSNGVHSVCSHSFGNLSLITASDRALPDREKPTLMPAAFTLIKSALLL
jgi:hypothetical protein